MYGMHDQRYRYPFQIDTSSVPRSYFSSASDDSDLESSVGGGGGRSADSAGRGSSQSTPQQSQNREFTHQHSQQDSPHIPSRQSLPQVPTPSIRRVSLPSVHQLSAALAEQSTAPAFSSDDRNRRETGRFQQFDHASTQSPISSGDGGQSEFVTLPPLIGLSNRHYPHPSLRSSTPSSSSASLSSHNSLTVTPSALHNQSTSPDAGDYLRHQLGLAPGTPVNLDCLPDPPPGQRPSQSYPVLIKLALYGSPNRMLTLKGIYEAIEERFEFFKKDKNGAWKRSIRHNLSLNRVFKNIPRPVSEPGKGSYWELDLSQGEGYKRERKRRKKGPSMHQQVKPRQGQQESETDSEEEEESEISSPSRSESPAQSIGPHRQVHATSLNRRSSPYPAGELNMRSHATSPAWAPGPVHAYAEDASRVETPWSPVYAGGQEQTNQGSGYVQPPFPLPIAMTGQEFSQQPVFRSGPFGHTVAWHAQQQMRQQSLSRHSSVAPQFPYSSSMHSVGGGHFQLGGPAVPSSITAGGFRVGSGEPGSTSVTSPMVAGAMRTGNSEFESLVLPSLVAPGAGRAGNSQLDSLILPSLIVSGAGRTGNSQLESLILPSLIVPGDSQYRAFGQSQIDEEPEETKDVGSAQGRESRQGSKGDRHESR